MNCMDFASYLARERHQQMLGEVDSLRLQKRLRENRAWIERLAVLCPRPQERTAVAGRSRTHEVTTTRRPVGERKGRIA
jgi:hypothetical protein